MKIVVDLNRCQGYAQCAFLAPNVLEVDGEEALMYMPPAPEHERGRVRRAAAACPVQAILVEEQAAPDVPWPQEQPDRHRRCRARRPARRRDPARGGLHR